MNKLDSELVDAFLGHVAPRGELTQQQAASILSVLSPKPIHQTTVSRWVSQGAKRLESHTREAIQAFLSGQRNGGGRVREHTVVMGDDPTIVSGMPDVAVLKPRARAIYDRAIGSFYTRSWPPQIIERAANDLMNYIKGARTLRSAGPGKPELTEDEQCMVLEGNLEAVEMAYGPNGIVRRF